MVSLPLHLHPINVVVYNDPQKSNLVAGFVLRCFQHLSDTDLDITQHKEQAKDILERIAEESSEVKVLKANLLLGEGKEEEAVTNITLPTIAGNSRKRNIRYPICSPATGCLP